MVQNLWLNIQSSVWLLRWQCLYPGAESAEELMRFEFERWIALGDYQAILDTDNGGIIAEASGGFSSFRKLPGVRNWSGENEPESHAFTTLA